MWFLSECLVESESCSYMPYWYGQIPWHFMTHPSLLSHLGDICRCHFVDQMVVPRLSLPRVKLLETHSTGMRQFILQDLVPSQAVFPYFTQRQTVDIEVIK